MCLGVYGRVVRVEGELAVVDFGGGLTKDALVGIEEVRGGDYVVVHAGIIVSRLSEEEFTEVFRYVEEAAKQLAQTESRVAEYLESMKMRLEENLSGQK
ncbi:MAG: HypC/HybG/HupF family hydrogenase formation chaperone [Nitrososphaerota archaeon]